MISSLPKRLGVRTRGTHIRRPRHTSHSASVERIEEQFERGVRLTAVLRPETKQHHAAGFDIGFHDSRTSAEHMLAQKPPTFQETLYWLSCYGSN